MIKPTSTTSEDKVPIRLVRWLLNRLAAAGSRLYADDHRAAEHGWQVITGRRGLSGYRDPRFGMLITCPHCGGIGGTGGRPCPTCQATGRLSRPLPVPARSREVPHRDRDPLTPAR